MVEVGVAVRVRGGDVADGVAGGVVEEGAVWPMIGACLLYTSDAADE